jgi:hypothetical protein
MAVSTITIYEETAKITVSDNETTISIDYSPNEVTLANEGHIIIVQTNGV